MKNLSLKPILGRGFLLPVLLIPLLALLLQLSWNVYFESFDEFVQRKELGVILNWKGIR